MFSRVAILIAFMTPIGFGATIRSAAADKAFTWLASKKQANGLYDSQADANDVCYTYDQAVAAIAFLTKGDTASAYGILNRYSLLQGSDGSWSNAYTSTNSVADGDKGLGPHAWICMAAAWYKQKTGSTQFDAMAKKALTWCLKYQAANGGITGGSTSSGTPLNYTSSEENEDAYAALKYFGFAAEADKVRGFLTTTAWDAANKRWFAGLNDTTDYLDVNPWGVQSLGVAGPTGYLSALDYNMSKMRLTKTVNNITVDGFDFNIDKDDIWLEGTGEMASAFYTAGRATDGDHFTDEIIKFQAADGGLAYSMAGGTTGDDGNMTTAEAISSTGWLIFAVGQINPFDFPATPVIVHYPAVIARGPSDTTVAAGQKATFSLTATGDKPIQYQWRRKGDTTVLATDSVLTLASILASDNNAFFYCIVSNAYGKDTSREAKLSVPGPGCDSTFGVTPDTVKAEGGQTVTLIGSATCATHFEWSVVSGPAPTMLDPEVLILSFTAPRLSADTIIVFRFTADFASGSKSKDVRVTVRKAPPASSLTKRDRIDDDAMPVALHGDRITWRASACAEIFSFQGRLLWEARGSDGFSIRLPSDILGLVRSGQAKLHFHRLPD